jgi:hypothetical protein
METLYLIACQEHRTTITVQPTIVPAVVTTNLELKQFGI